MSSTLVCATCILRKGCPSVRVEGQTGIRHDMLHDLCGLFYTKGVLVGHLKCTVLQRMLRVCETWPESASPR